MPDNTVEVDGCFLFALSAAQEDNTSQTIGNASAGNKLPQSLDCLHENKLPLKHVIKACKTLLSVCTNKMPMFGQEACAIVEKEGKRDSQSGYFTCHCYAVFCLTFLKCP